MARARPAPDMPADFDCDVVVIGGGPAGSTAASALARAGRTVVLLERDRFPRFHIGESLLASVNDVFDAIGVADRIRADGFPQKWGATFMTPDGRVERFADFAISDEVRGAADVAGAARAHGHAAARARRGQRRRRAAGPPRPRRRLRRRRRDGVGAAAGDRRRVDRRRPRSGPASWSTRRGGPACSRAPSRCASTSRRWPTSRSSRTTPACRARRAAAPATSASSPAAISAGSG